MKILLTGSTGFVGSAIAKGIIDSTLRNCSVRKMPAHFKINHNNIYYKVIGDIDNQTEWDDVLIGVDTVALRSYNQAEKI